eukprot:SAG31_NODE_19399_length_603_cov_1.273810_1_plen_71_part_00
MGEGGRGLGVWGEGRMYVWVCVCVCLLAVRLEVLPRISSSAARTTVPVYKADLLDANWYPEHAYLLVFQY